MDPVEVAERLILKTLSQLRRTQSSLEQLNAEGGVAELLVSVYAHDEFRLELPSDFLTSLGRMYLSVALDIHPHSPLKTSVSRPN